MKTTIKFSLFLSLLLIFPFAQAQMWTPLEMHSGGKVTGIVAHPTSATTVFARTDVAGIYKSTNRGDDWQQLLINVPKYSDHTFKIRSFVINPTNADEMFFASGNSAGGDQSGIWKSSDGGNSWQLKTELAAFSGNGKYRWADEVMAYRPGTTTTLFAGAQPKVVAGNAEKGGLFTSADSGNTWTKVNTPIFDNRWITKVLFDPTNDDILYVAAANSGVSGLSTDGGLWKYTISTDTFAQLTTNEVVDVDFDAVDKNTMMAVGPLGIFISNNKGTTWSVPVTPFGKEYTSFVTPHPTEADHWFFGGTAGFFTNGFLETDDALATSYFTTYGVPNSPNMQKITWPPYAAANTNTQPVFGGALSNFFFHPLEPATAYFNNVWRCDTATGLLVNKTNSNEKTNANWDWTFTSKGIYIMVGIRVSPHPSNVNRFTLNVADVNQYETLDNGGDMLYYGLMDRLNNSSTTKYFPGNDQIRYSAGNDFNEDGTLNKTTDGGTTWTEMSSAFFDGSRVIQDLEIDPNDSNLIIVGLENTTLPSQIYKSTDGGNSFTAWDTGTNNEQIFKRWEAFPRLIQDKDGQTYYVWSDDKLFKRGINDASWTQIPLPVTTTPIRRITTARDVPGSLYAVFNQNNQLHVSKDYGATWAAYPLPYNGDSEFVSISPSGNRAIVARRENWTNKREFAVYINNTFETGGSWTPVSLTTHPSTTKTMVFLTEDRIVSVSRGHGSFYTEIPTGTLNINETPSRSTFTLSPNPAGDLVNIYVDAAYKKSTLPYSIIDMSGRMVEKSEGKVNNGFAKIDISRLEKGVYFLLVKVENGEEISLKLMKR